MIQIEEIKPEDKDLKKYGVFIKVKAGRHDEQNRNYDVLSERDLEEIEDLIAIYEDSQ